MRSATYLSSAEIGESGCTAFLKSFSCCKMEGPRGRRIFAPAVLMGKVAPILAVRQTASKLRRLAVGERWRNSGAWSLAVSGIWEGNDPLWNHGCERMVSSAGRCSDNYQQDVEWRVSSGILPGSVLRIDMIRSCAEDEMTLSTGNS